MVPALDRDDDARGYLVAVIVYPDLDHLKPAGEFVALWAVFHQFDGGDDVVRGVAFDGDLRIDGAHERAMAARARSFVAAMVDDDDGAIEGIADRVGGLDIGRHVAIVAFGTGKRSVQRVDARSRPVWHAKSGADGGYERGMIGDEVHCVEAIR